jgi:hypothetical protein
MRAAAFPMCAEDATPKANPSTGNDTHLWLGARMAN